MGRPLVILGASGNAYDVFDVVEAINCASSTWEVIGFLDDGCEPDTRFLGQPVLGGIPHAAELRDCHFVNAIGSDSTFKRRAEIIERTGVSIDRFGTLIHPGACVSVRARVGKGVCINYGATIAGAAMIRDDVWIGPSVAIGHDSLIGDHTVIAPGAIVSGNVRIGHSCYLGAGSLLRQRVVVGDEALVGMGAVVVRDVLADATVIGNPARNIRQPLLV